MRIGRRRFLGFLGVVATRASAEWRPPARDDVGQVIAVSGVVAPVRLA